MAKWLGVAAVIVVVLVGGYFLFAKSNNGPTGSTTNTIPQPTVSITDKVTQENPVGQTTVILSDKGFIPFTLAVKAGTKVTWINKSGGTATVSSDPHPTHTNYPPLNLGKFDDGAALTLTFDKAGTYSYHNHLNPSQKGIIMVRE